MDWCDFFSGASASLNVILGCLCAYLARRRPSDHVADHLALDDADPIRLSLSEMDRDGVSKSFPVIILDSGDQFRVLDVVKVGRFASKIRYRMVKPIAGAVIGTGAIRHNAIAFIGPVKMADDEGVEA